ncbi:hypothetical protein [Streptomyces alanosinicus]|uniref:Uncharacterized protein n=1 Tax=Streptomyces alanosinicus TaxID=68171 RepID=A0A918YSM4_9ACTN|nr:hypothetical protein [Streptomyces alanosinicus]GHE14676.1 hypothetical protein GCM10010339_86270 [Streptomyces alanosinicus]
MSNTVSSHLALQYGNDVFLPAGIALTTPLVLLAIREYRREKPALALLIPIALMSVFADSGARFLTGLRMVPAEEHPVLYQAFGYPTPAWTLALYTSYFAYLAYLGHQSISERWPRKKFWLVMAFLLTFEIAFEYVLIHAMELCSYVGENQPLRMFRLPLFWPVVWIACPVLAGMLLCVLGEHLKSVHRLLLLPIIASGNMGFAVVLAWPTVQAVHSPLGSAGVSAIAVANVVAIVLTLHAVGRFSASPSGAPAPEQAAVSHGARR